MRKVKARAPVIEKKTNTKRKISILKFVIKCEKVKPPLEEKLVAQPKRYDKRRGSRIHP